MNLAEEARDYAAAGALAEEIPYWGWLPYQPVSKVALGDNNISYG